jgi:DNA primase
MSTIDEVKQRLDIVDVVGGYLKLDKAGRNFKALCPFHDEKTPSFFVFPDRQSWRCFGCGAGGDLVSFVQKREGIDFGEALKMLAERAGVPLSRQRDTAADKLIDRFFQINEAAAGYYHDMLLKAPAAEPARNYISGRGVDQKTIDDFQLGFSSGEGLKNHFRDKGFEESELLAVGLVGEKEGRTYDYFRHRLMFPIRDIKGRVVGFGARALDESLPKYLNSRQTSVFDKSGVLYGIDRARAAIRERDQAVIVEGYMDVIAAHQYGESNVVASMGTALTEKQIKILKGLTSRLAFALDPDVAGNAATVRGIEVARRSLDRENLEMPTVLGATTRLRADISIIALPQGKDPDALIRDDSQQWRQLVEESVPLMDHLIAAAVAKLDISRPEGKSVASDQLLPLIAELADETQREFYLNKLSNLLGIKEKTLIEKVAARLGTRKEKASPVKPRPSSITHLGDPPEEYCLTLLLHHPELRGMADHLLPEHFERSENREVFIAWRSTPDVDSLPEVIDAVLGDHLESLLGRTLPPADELIWEKDLASCIGNLEEKRLKLKNEFITSEIVAGLKDGEELDSAKLATLQKIPTEVNAELVRKMQERTGPSISWRED